ARSDFTSGPSSAIPASTVSRVSYSKRALRWVATSLRSPGAAIPAQGNAARARARGSGPRGRQLPAQRHALDPADERRADALDRPGLLGVSHAREQLLEQARDLEPREVGPQADVLAAPEADVVVRPAVDAEAVAVGEDLLVAVRRGVEEAGGLARADLLAAQLEVARGGPAELDHRRGPAHDLLDRRREHARLRAPPRPPPP